MTMILLDTPKPQPLTLADKHGAFMKVTNEEYNRAHAVKTLDDLIAIKNARHALDHERSRLFFFVGLVLSLGVILLAFEWKSYDPKGIVDLGTLTNDFNEILEIPVTEQAPPPPPQKVTVPNLVAVSDEVLVNEIEVEIDAEISQSDLIQDVVYEDVFIEPEEEKVEEIFDIVETPATPVGGMQAFYDYVAENLKYPDNALRIGVSGKVFVQFVVEKDGTLTDVKVLKGIHESCDSEAVRVVRNAPKWEPGKQRGRAVRVYQRLPIVFVFKEGNM